jgi:hypothetical protein
MAEQDANKLVDHVPCLQYQASASFSHWFIGLAPLFLNLDIRFELSEDGG